MGMLHSTSTVAMSTYTTGEFIKNWRARYFVLRSDGTFTGYKQPPVGGIYPEIMNEFNVEGTPF